MRSDQPVHLDDLIVWVFGTGRCYGVLGGGT